MGFLYEDAGTPLHLLVHIICYSETAMETARTDKQVYKLFRVSVILKGIISAGEIVVGIIAFFVPVTLLTELVASFARSELQSEPGSYIAAHVLTLTQGVPEVSTLFLGLYLLSRGLIKLILVWALLKNQLWAYPSSLVVLGLFVAYQLYEIERTHSIFVVAITLFDLAVMYFIWREYRVVKAHIHKKHQSL